mgnify:FL=1
MESKPRVSARASNARASNVFGGRHTADPRPISDKQYQVSCQKRILEYLHSNRSDLVITMKSLQLPTSKDFMTVLLALVHKIDPQYEILGKLEDEVPTLFKNLGYPFSISKNSLLAVGAPNTWPSLLGALTWLLDLVLYIEATHEDQDEYDSEVTQENLFSEHLMQAYELFITGQDYSEELEELRYKLEVRVKEVHTQITRFKELISSKKKEKEVLKHNQVNPKSLDDQIRYLEEHNSNLNYFTELKAHKQQLEAQLEYLVTENEANKETLAAEREQLETILKQLQTQALSKEDIERIKEETTSYQSTLNKVLQQKDEFQKFQWELQKKLERVTAEASNLCKHYHHTAKELYLLPPGAKYSSGLDLRVGVNTQAIEDYPLEESKLLMPANFLNPLSKATQALLEDVQKKIEEHAKEKTIMENINHEKLSTVPDLEEKLRQTNSDLDNRKKSYISDPHSFKTLIEQKNKDFEELNCETTKIQENISDCKLELSASCELEEDLKKKLTHLQSELPRKLGEYEQYIKQDIEFYYNHKIKVVNFMSELKQFAENQLKELRTN